MDNPEAKGYISNLKFAGNKVIYSGKGWIGDAVLQVQGNESSFLCGIENTMGACNNDGIYITDNLFYLSEGAIIDYKEYLWESETSVNKAPVFSNNIFAQHKFGWLAFWNERAAALTEENVKNILGDKTGKVIIIE
jgi:hypothetical protein